MCVSESLLLLTSVLSFNGCLTLFFSLQLPISGEERRPPAPPDVRRKGWKRGTEVERGLFSKIWNSLGHETCLTAWFEFDTLKEIHEDQVSLFDDAT